jgi:hypothetical protein
MTDRGSMLKAAEAQKTGKPLPVLGSWNESNSPDDDNPVQTIVVAGARKDNQRTFQICVNIPIRAIAGHRRGRRVRGACAIAATRPAYAGRSRVGRLRETQIQVSSM